MDGDRLIEGMTGALAHSKGELELKTRVVTISTPDVRDIRKRLNMSRKEFAAAFGFTKSSVRNWEQGARRPSRTARILLAVIERHPGLIKDTIDSIGKD